ncbi:MAG: hypothetical protein HY508_04720 [Acidobacteria bacterium]|nr:hypothetical protein [Acidobacteriota bacterium]
MKQAKLGIPIAEVIRQVSVSEQTFHGCMKKYSGLEVDQVQQSKQMREENARLKRIVEDLPPGASRSFRPGRGTASPTWTRCSCRRHIAGDQFCPRSLPPETAEGLSVGPQAGEVNVGTN